MNIDLRGKTAIVTGGDGAIGTAICERFAQTGCNVIIVGIDVEKGQKLASELSQKYSIKSSQIYGDVTDKDSMIEMSKKAIADYGRIDFLINNAGINVGNDRRKPINGRWKNRKHKLYSGPRSRKEYLLIFRGKGGGSEPHKGHGP